MKISNERELQQIQFKHLSDIDFQDFMNLYKKCTADPYYFLVIDTILASDNYLRFRKDFNREAAKISALSSDKIDKYEYPTGEEILPSDQSRIIEQVKFTYSPLGKALVKQIKTIENQGEKQRKALEEHGKQLFKYSDEKESLANSKQKEIFEETANRRIEEIQFLSKQIDLNNLTYYFKGESSSVKWGLLARNEVGLFQIFNHVKTIKNH